MGVGGGGLAWRCVPREEKPYARRQNPKQRGAAIGVGTVLNCGGGGLGGRVLATKRARVPLAARAPPSSCVLTKRVGTSKIKLICRLLICRLLTNKQAATVRLREFSAERLRPGAQRAPSGNARLRTYLIVPTATRIHSATDVAHGIRRLGLHTSRLCLPLEAFAHIVYLRIPYVPCQSSPPPSGVWL